MMKKKYLAIDFIIGCSLLLIGLSASFQAVAEINDPLKQLVKSNPTTKSLKYSAIFQGRGDGIHTCPVTGERVTKKSLSGEYFGRTVYFCCHGCLKAAQQNPEKFVKATFAEQQTAAKAFIAKSALTSDGAEYCSD
jgi:YHS domain-containing protein